MKLKNVLYPVMILAAAMMVSGCEEETPGNGITENLSFTKLSVIDGSSTSDGVTLRVEHNGTSADSWYGFVTDDLKSSDMKLLNDEYVKLLAGGDFDRLNRETKANIVLKDLKENTTYKYIVFAVTADGTMYGTYSSVKFTTSVNQYVMTRTDDWTIAVQSPRPDPVTDYLGVSYSGTGRYYFAVYTEEYINSYKKEYPDGIPLTSTSGYTLATLDVLNYLMIYEIINLQTACYDTDGTFDTDKFQTYTMEGNGTYNLGYRLSKGNYVAVVFGFDSNGNHTGKYSSIEFSVAEDSTPEEAYNKWIGKWTVKGKTADSKGKATGKEVSYDIDIACKENNHLYTVTGWETGTDIDVDMSEAFWSWDSEKNEGKFIEVSFPAYYENGRLIFKESDVSYYRTTSGYWYLGLYGYATIQSKFAPVLLAGTNMAAASFKDEECKSAELLGCEAKYDSYTWTYTQFGYLSYNASLDHRVYNDPVILVSEKAAANNPSHPDITTLTKTSDTASGPSGDDTPAASVTPVRSNRMMVTPEEFHVGYKSNVSAWKPRLYMPL